MKIKAATGIRNQTTYANDTAQLTATFSSSDSLSGTSAITEVVVTTAASAGIILCRQVYSPADNCNWDAGDTLQVTVKIQIKQGS